MKKFTIEETTDKIDIFFTQLRACEDWQFIDIFFTQLQACEDGQFLLIRKSY